MQRAADKNFDKFELYALNNVFRVPTEVSEAPEDGADQSGIDAELEELWAQLRQELATKSELQQRVAAASRETQRWEAHQHTVEGLCTTRRSEALVRVLHEARQLDEELRRGREQLHGSTAEGPACVQKALSDRRIQISTVTRGPGQTPVPLPPTRLHRRIPTQPPASTAASPPPNGALLPHTRDPALLACAGRRVGPEGLVIDALHVNASGSARHGHPHTPTSRAGSAVIRFASVRKRRRCPMVWLCQRTSGVIIMRRCRCHPRSFKEGQWVETCGGVASYICGMSNF